ncbi:MAG: hypothetical protein K5846_02425 [Bacteroidales bacterium]|nr:hypothetical protein [Bacteroidales bacterium]
MKKTILLGAILVLGLFFVSCEKEGQYTPKNKIDRISYSSSTTFQMYLNDVWNDVGTSTVSKYVSEIWNWDGKMLKSITHYNDKGELMYTENYEYDGKRLVSVSWGTAGRYTISYDKGKISTIDGYNGTEKMITYVFSHENGKVTKIAITDYDAKKAAVNPLPTNILRFFIPNANIQSLKEMMKSIQSDPNTKEIESYDINFEWTGNNISKMTMLRGASTTTANYTYDNKTNPFYGLFDISEYSYIQIMSKNNVTRLVAENSNNVHEERDYIYTYEKDLPTMQTCSYKQPVEGDIYRNSISEIYTYEYKK